MNDPLNIGFSPCPNDTFIFDALINKKIDLGGIEYQPFIRDVEELNRNAFSSVLPVTKLSFHAYAPVANDDYLLRSGGALGRGCGPILIANDIDILSKKELKDLAVAIPGKFTTANFLLSMAYPDLLNKKEMIFSDVESAVLNGTVDLGLIIHENRFTYEARDLKKIRDLGEFWEQTTGDPIPLGAIVISRHLPPDIIKQVQHSLKESVEFALREPGSSKEYVKKYSQELDDKVIESHIELYVNQFSVDIGEEGERAIRSLYRIAEEREVISNMRSDIFVEN